MISVVGLGNVLMTDDAWGPAVVRCFDAWYRVEPEVEIEDLGTPGFDLLPHLRGRDRLLVVDTVRAAQPPGTLRLYSRAELLAHAPGPRTSPHDPGLKEALLSLEIHGESPRDFRLLGVVPSRTGQGTLLTEVVASTLGPACTAIADQLREWGCEVTLRHPSRQPELWWVEEEQLRARGVV